MRFTWFGSVWGITWGGIMGGIACARGIFPPGE